MQFNEHDIHHKFKRFQFNVEFSLREHSFNKMNVLLVVHLEYL